ncbi:Uncharacterised protein [Vibrio cholerae]|nr:Uncharacterised protein [Vibrio cholerae]CSC70534.1 Uncharacterised protein [Vibrio cholerae]
MLCKPLLINSMNSKGSRKPRANSFSTKLFAVKWILY